MGVYFNPSNESFTKDRNYKIYIDKTGLLEYLNESLGTPKNCIALSHARRFGKSHAAGMIDAYYSLGYDAERKSAYIPNYEVATAFEAALQIGEWKDIAKIISRCDELLFATINYDAEEKSPTRISLRGVCAKKFLRHGE